MSFERGATEVFNRGDRCERAETELVKEYETALAGMNSSLQQLLKKNKQLEAQLANAQLQSISFDSISLPGHEPIREKLAKSEAEKEKLQGRYKLVEQQLERTIKKLQQANEKMVTMEMDYRDLDDKVGWGF